MKRHLAVLLVAAFTLAGCQTGQKIESFVTGAANPLSNNQLGAAISTYGLVDSAVIAYRSLPRCTISRNFSATNICYKRSILVKLQAYDLAANKTINSAVAFQRNNPTLDASAYISAAVAAVDTFKAFAVASNLPGVQ